MHDRTLTLYIDPPSMHFLQDRLFDVDTASLCGDTILAPYVHLRDRLAAQGIRVRTADYLPQSQCAAAYNIYISLGLLKNYKRIAARKDTILSAFFAMESPIVEPSLYRELKQIQCYFKRVFSWSTGQALQPFTGECLPLNSFRVPQSFDEVHEKLWQRMDRKFLVMINANKLPRRYWHELYTERLRAVEFFNRRGEIDLYGPGWNESPFRVGKTRVPWTLRRGLRALQHHYQRLRPDPLLSAARQAHKGISPSKSETLSQYTFALCFENMVLEGYITEKIFDCFFAGTIPIYWGEPHIERYIPCDCYVDMRRFDSYDHLRHFLHSLSKQEIEGYRENARAFLESPAFYPFSKDAFVELFLRLLKEDAGVEMGSQ